MLNPTSPLETTAPARWAGESRTGLSPPAQWKIKETTSKTYGVYTPLNRHHGHSLRLTTTFPLPHRHSSIYIHLTVSTQPASRSRKPAHCKDSSAPSVPQATMASSFSLDQFPNEIQYLIFEELYHTCRLEHRRTTAYASVGWVWKWFFEAKHFERLQVTVSLVSRFGKIVNENRRQLVKHIWYDFPPLAVCCGPRLRIYA